MRLMIIFRKKGDTTTYFCEGEKKRATFSNSSIFRELQSRFTVQ